MFLFLLIWNKQIEVLEYNFKQYSIIGLWKCCPLGVPNFFINQKKIDEVLFSPTSFIDVA